MRLKWLIERVAVPGLVLTEQPDKADQYEEGKLALGMRRDERTDLTGKLHPLHPIDCSNPVENEKARLP